MNIQTYGENPSVIWLDADPPELEVKDLVDKAKVAPLQKLKADLKITVAYSSPHLREVLGEASWKLRK